MEGASTASEAYTAELKHNGWTMVMVGMGLVALCLVIFVGTIAFAVWTIGRPLRALTRPIEELAKGNCVVSVPGVRRGDEIGQIAGRAGRWKNDGTFGVTADCEPFDEETVNRIETHRYDPVRVAQ